MAMKALLAEFQIGWCCETPNDNATTLWMNHTPALSGEPTDEADLPGAAGLFWLAPWDRPVSIESEDDNGEGREASCGCGGGTTRTRGVNLHEAQSGDHPRVVDHEDLVEAETHRSSVEQMQFALQARQREAEWVHTVGIGVLADQPVVVVKTQRHPKDLDEHLRRCGLWQEALRRENAPVIVDTHQTAKFFAHGMGAKSPGGDLAWVQERVAEAIESRQAQSLGPQFFVMAASQLPEFIREVNEAPLNARDKPRTALVMEFSRGDLVHPQMRKINFGKEAAQLHPRCRRINHLSAVPDTQGAHYAAEGMSPVASPMASTAASTRTFMTQGTTVADSSEHSLSDGDGRASTASLLTSSDVRSPQSAWQVPPMPWPAGFSQVSPFPAGVRGPPFN